MTGPLKVTVDLPDITLRLDLRTVAQHGAMAMRDFWADKLEEGRQPTGEPLPTNAKGEPLGRGQGTLIKKWIVKSMGRKPRMGRAFVEPYNKGKYKQAIWQLAKRGLLFQSFRGASEIAWRRIAQEVMDDAVNEALDGNRKKRRRRVGRWRA